MPSRSDWAIPGLRVVAPTSIKTYNSTAQLWPDIYAAIQSTSGADHFVYLLGWDVEIEKILPLIAGRVDSCLRAVLGSADNRGVQVRAIFDSDITLGYRHNNNKRAVDFINSLKNGGAVLDSRVLFAGCHHQKLVVVMGANGLVAFAGGLDIALDRPRFVDVHCQVAGGAAAGLLSLFGQRWTEHPVVQSLPLARQRLRALRIADAQPDATNQVQVGRTYGNAAAHRGLNWFEDFIGQIGSETWLPTKPTTYGFAPKGEFTALALIANGIARASNYIYVEDQYLFASEMKGQPDIRDLLAKRLAEVPGLKFIALINRTEKIIGEMALPWTYRKKFIDKVKSGNPGKVVILQYAAAESPFLLHSKCWIFDDAFAVFGSANCNRRGLSHDSELMLGITGARSNGSEFAAELRSKLWLNHLNPKSGSPKFTAKDVNSWQDGLKLMLAPGSRLEPYDENAGKDPPFTVPQILRSLGYDGTSPAGRTRYWDDLADPDGS